MRFKKDSYTFYLYIVNKQNWILGIAISLGLSLISLSVRWMINEDLPLVVIVGSSLYHFLFGIICWLLHTFLLGKQKKFSFLGSSYIYSVICIIAVSASTFMYDWLFGFLISDLIQLSSIISINKPVNTVIRGTMASSLYFFVVYYTHILSEKQQHGIEIERLKQAQLAANLSSLKEQLNPHFLFNTLNTLTSLTQEKTVKDYVAELANVYRYMLQHNKMDAVSLQQELSFIESYLYIIKARMEKAIAIDIKVEESLAQSQIPPLTLQLLIENAIKHNIASSSRQLKIDIYTDDEGYLVVSNNFQPKSSIQFSTGIGLDNVMQRYDLLFKKDIIIEKTAASFTVKLPINENTDYRR